MWFAPDGSRFDDEAADRVVGQHFRATLDVANEHGTRVEPVGHGTVLSAVVVGDGMGMSLVVDWPE